MQKTLGRESAKQTLNDALLQMKMNDSVVHAATVFKNDRTYWRSAAPLPRFLVAFPWRTQAVHRFDPCWIGALALIDCGKRKSRWISVLPRSKGLEGLSTAES